MRDAIMILFWRHGYDGVTLAQIEDAAGVCKTSLYASFGNKEQLFRAAIQRYLQKAVGLQLTAMDEAQSLSDAIGVLLRSAATTYADDQLRSGCMVLTGTVASHPDDADFVAMLADTRNDFRQALVEKLRRWTQPDVALMLARGLVGVMQGLALQVHDGASSEDVIEIASVMAQAMTDRFERRSPSKT